jgi:hypothetical protein
MKKIPIIILSINVAIALTLSGCAKTEYVTVTDTIVRWTQEIGQVVKVESC